jgi:hypothetical protein
MQVSRVACRASSMMKTARSPLQKTTQTKTKNRGGEARGAPKYFIGSALPPRSIPQLGGVSNSSR